MCVCVCVYAGVWGCVGGCWIPASRAFDVMGSRLTQIRSGELVP